MQHVSVQISVNAFQAFYLRVFVYFVVLAN